MDFALEPLRIDDLKELFSLHYEEVGSFKELGLEPNYEAILMCDKVGAVRVYTARVEGKLVGYNIFTVFPDMFHKNHKNASEVALYIHPDHRGNGFTFMKWVDSALDSDIIYRSTKMCFDFGFLLRRAGYEKIDTVYGKLK